MTQPAPTPQDKTQTDSIPVCRVDCPPEVMMNRESLKALAMDTRDKVAKATDCEPHQTERRNCITLSVMD